MSKELSSEDWMAQELPVYWVTINESKLNSFNQEIIRKWLNHNVETWWYNDGTTYAFGEKKMLTTFKLWILSDAFNSTYGIAEKAED